MLRAPIREYELAPAGVHKARCVRVIDLGSHFNTKWNKIQRKVLFQFELAETKMENGTPFAVIRKYTLSMTGGVWKTDLRKALESWRGKPFNDNEAKDFDILSILGVPATLNIIHNQDDGKTYANFNEPIPLSQKDCPERINELIGFSLDDYNQETFDKIPEYFQEIIKDSQEYKVLMDNSGNDDSVQDSVSGYQVVVETNSDIAEEEIPF